MITGLGADLIEVDRIGLRIAREAGFRELVFSTHEIEYCESKGNPFEHYAARFAAKEAFFKALGTGWMADTPWNEIEIKNDEAGKPEFCFLGGVQKVMGNIGIQKVLVSLSHLKTIASAVVVIEK
ncbi:MAG TPA: holo-ACP synthase [Chitinophagaceae bacterium]|nr:holo-ACP synthase [Chitinophagaceae bacterium]